MPYPNHWLLQFGGTLGSTSGEIWSCGIRLMESGLDNLDPEEYLDATAVPALSAWFGGAAASISVNAKLRFAKCNAIGPDGLYSDPTEVHERYDESFGTGVSGGSGGTVLPYQIALCYTWHTNAAERGPGSRGRIYVPLVTGGIDGSTGLLSPGAQTSHANAAAALINSLDAGLAGIGGTIRPCIASAVGAGALNQIDAVSVDSRFDVQRRRANSLVGVRTRVEVDY